MREGGATESEDVRYEFQIRDIGGWRVHARSESALTELEKLSRWEPSAVEFGARVIRIRTTVEILTVEER